MPVDAAFIQRLRQRTASTFIAAAPYGDAEMAAYVVSQVVRLRRLTAETSAESPYGDEELAEYIVETIVTDMTTRLTGSSAVDTRFAPLPVTFDLNAAASRVWEEKLNALIGAGTYDYSADGQSFSMGQLVEQYQQRAAYYMARRRVKSVRLVAKKTASTDIDRLDGRL